MSVHQLVSSRTKSRQGGSTRRRTERAGHSSLWAVRAAVGLIVSLAVAPALADDFNSYTLAGSFTLPAVSPIGVLGDGRIVTLNGADVYTETGLGAHTFSQFGTLPNMDVPGYAAAFVRVSPDGTQLAVGNNGGASYTNYQVGVFNLSNLTGAWFPAAHYDGAWFDATHFALTAGDVGQPSRVTLLDVSSNPGNPLNPTVVQNITGASAGVTFDAAGRLYAGNGGAGGDPNQTGWIKAFAPGDWQAALHGGPAVDFQQSGTLIADVLSAGSLGFDREGNLHVGGGDYIGGIDVDYAGLVHASAIANALNGGGPAGSGDIRHFDPDQSHSNYYDVTYNAITHELYLRDNASVWVYAVPEPAALALVAVCLLFVRRRMRVMP